MTGLVIRPGTCKHLHWLTLCDCRITSSLTDSVWLYNHTFTDWLCVTVGLHLYWLTLPTVGSCLHWLTLCDCRITQYSQGLALCQQSTTESGIVFIAQFHVPVSTQLLLGLVYWIMYNGLLKSSHHRQYAILSAFDAKYNIRTAPGKISKCFDNPVSGYSIEGPWCIFF